uniref:C1q domain-containing protein n=1 Tax=Xiphophorus couchianus TaxID=32473 RepID=A0A3B5LMI0_9TELE
MFLFLLLVFSFSTVQLQGQNEPKGAEHLKQLDSPGTEPRTVSTLQQVCSNDIHAVLREVSASVAGLKVGMEYLQKENVKQVAFSASLMASGGGDIGPFNAYTSLIFRNVVSNVGNAYNPNTGFFTAPVRGVYHFNYHIYGHGHPSHGSGAVLVKNGEYIFMAYEHQTTLGANSANTVTFLLEGGDVVYLLQRAHTRIFDDQLHYTTFSGLLLFPLLKQLKENQG